MCCDDGVEAGKLLAAPNKLEDAELDGGQKGCAGMRPLSPGLVTVIAAGGTLLSCCPDTPHRHNTPATHVTVTQSSGHLNIAQVAGHRGACTPTDIVKGKRARKGRLKMGRKGRLKRL